MANDNDDPDFLNQLTFEPLTIANWNNFVQLFGSKGACGNCWCMYYRLKKSDYQEGKADEWEQSCHERARMEGETNRHSWVL